MIVTLKPQIFKKFPQFRLVLIKADNLDNKSKLEQSVHLLKEVEQVFFSY